MTEIAKGGSKSFGPPITRGLPIIFLCLVALAYAWVAIPLTLIPQEGLHTYSGGPVGNDFLAFYSASLLIWRHSAADIFDFARLFPFEDAFSGTSTHLPCPYPPHFLLYIAPLATMPYLPALYFWIVATAAPFVMIVRKLSGLATPMIALAPPLVQNAIAGQNGALTASLFAAGLILLANRRSAMAGVLFALLSYKPQVFVLIPICLLAAREYRALAWVAVTGLALLMGSVAVFGLETWERFFGILPQQMSFILTGDAPAGRCPTVFVLIFYATGNLALAKISQGVSTLAAWALVAWSWRSSKAIYPRTLMFCVALPLSAPYMFEYDLAVWTLPAAILLVRLWRGEGRAPDWIALPVLWLLPSAIWLVSLTGLHLSAVAMLALAPYAVWCVLREQSPRPQFRRSALAAPA